MHVINAIIQSLGIVGVQYFGWIYAIYPSIALSAFMVCVQTFGIAGVFSRIAKIGDPDPEKTGRPTGTTILVSMLYIATAYQVHLIGHSIIAGVIIAHASITILTSLMKLLNKSV